MFSTIARDMRIERLAYLAKADDASTQHMSHAVEQNLRLTDSSVALSREASDMLEGITQSVKNIELMNEQKRWRRKSRPALAKRLAGG